MTFSQFLKDTWCFWVCFIIIYRLLLSVLFPALSLLSTVQQKATSIIRPSNKESREEGFKMSVCFLSPRASPLFFLNAAQVGLMLFSRSLKPDVNSLFTVQWIHTEHRACSGPTRLHLMKNFCNLLLRSERVDPLAVLGGQKETHKSPQTEKSIPALNKRFFKKNNQTKKKTKLFVNQWVRGSIRSPRWHHQSELEASSWIKKPWLLINSLAEKCLLHALMLQLSFFSFYI